MVWFIIIIYFSSIVTKAILSIQSNANLFLEPTSTEQLGVSSLLAQTITSMTCRFLCFANMR